MLKATATVLNPPQSPMMNALYGDAVAAVVYDRCQAMGSDFNRRVQAYVYDQIWADPRIPLKEKSLVTVVALAAFNKVEQLKIHFWGAFHQGFSYQSMQALLALMVDKGYLRASADAEAVLSDARQEYQGITGGVLTDGSPAISPREVAVIDFVAHIVQGDNDRSLQCMRTLLAQHDLSEADMKAIMPHAAVYCGFPVEMNGLAALNTALATPLIGLRR